MAAQPVSQPTPIVFIVDDDVSVRESLELLIGAENLRAETFASAQEFLSRPRAAIPSCLILDLALPDLNGLDVQKRIADRVDIPIIFLTGYGDIPTTVQAMKAGAAEFFTKPFDTDALLAAIREAIRRSEAALVAGLPVSGLIMRHAKQPAPNIFLGVSGCDVAMQTQKSVLYYVLRLVRGQSQTDQVSQQGLA